MSWLPKTGDRTEFTYSEGCSVCGENRTFSCVQVFTDRGEWHTIEELETPHVCSTDNESSDERD